MNIFNTLVAIMAMISLFLFSLRGFSKQLQTLGSDKMQVWLGKITSNRFSGFLLGAMLTAIIQSSSAVTSITVALVDSGVITFYNSLAVLVGTNIGTTFTAWLITFKLDALGPYLLIVGTIVGFFPHRIHIAGKSIFYLGLILFSLKLISETLEPIRGSEEVIQFLSMSSHPIAGVIIGIIATTIVQSSSVTTGLVIVLAGQQLLTLEAAVAIVVGSNVGTTSTALLAATQMSRSAKLSAQANFVFNTIGLLVFLPFIVPFTKLMSLIPGHLTVQIATAHLAFNLLVAAAVFPFLKQIGSFLERRSRKQSKELDI